MRILCALAFACALSLLAAGPASAASVTPQVIAGNPSCADLNADPAFTGITSNFGLKVNGAAPNGTYTITNGPGRELTGGAPSDPANSVTISNSNGTTFDWSATLGIDAVIVKGGDDANAYVYSPEAFSDTNLVSPPNNGGQVPQVSHVEFCFDVGLDVEKTVQPKLKRTWTWDIEKTGDQTTGGPLNPGDVFNVNYDVTLSATSADSDYAVEGTITVTNNTTLATTVNTVTDQLNDGTNATVTCPALPAVLNPGDDLQCTYTASGLDGNETTNTATVTATGGAQGGTDDAAIDWNAATVDSVDECVDVVDDKGGPLGTVCAPQDLTNGSKTFQYTLDVAAGGSCTDHTNTAMFTTNDTATTGSDSWTVALTCAQPPPDNPVVPNTPQNPGEPQPQQPPGQQQVLGERVNPGTARLAGATGCQGSPFTVRVKGRSIRLVQFRVDGRLRATDRTPDSAGRYTFRINPRRFKPGSHRVTARAVFVTESNTQPKTMTLRFSRCVRAAQAPAFTG